MKIQRDQDLSNYNTLALRARADYFCEVDSLDVLNQALAFAQARNLPITILGGGSNVVLAGDLPGLTLRMAVTGREVVANLDDAVQVKFGAGENWHETVCYCLGQGWYGLENLALIPGTVGAAPIQNIGAYGVELESCFVELEALAMDSKESVTFHHVDCEFVYRDSIFKGRFKDQYVITSVTLELSKTSRPVLKYPALQAALSREFKIEIKPETTSVTAQQVAEMVCRIRSEKLPDPAVIPNVGSFFKNPIVSSEQADDLLEQFPGLAFYPQLDGRVKLAAAWLIDHAGWKGLEKNGVAVHRDQALVLVNIKKTAGNAGATLLNFAAEIQADVKNKFGVNLDIEPIVLGASQA